MRVSSESTKGLDQVKDSAKTGRTSEIKEKHSGRAANKTSKSPDIESSDKVQLSTKGRDVAKVKAAAMSAPDVNEEKVERLKRAVASGTYNVDADKVADRLVDEHINTMY